MSRTGNRPTMAAEVIWPCLSRLIISGFVILQDTLKRIRLFLYNVRHRTATLDFQSADASADCKPADEQMECHGENDAGTNCRLVRVLTNTVLSKRFFLRYN